MAKGIKDPLLYKTELEKHIRECLDSSNLYFWYLILYLSQTFLILSI